MQICVVFFPRGHRIWLVRARRGENGVPKPGQRFVLRKIGEHCRCPCGSGAGYDGPVDLVARNQFERRAVCFRDRAVYPADFFRILLREQGRIIAGDCQSRRATPVRLSHAFIEPRCGGIEARVPTVTKAKQRRLLVSKQRGDKGGAGFVGMLRDAARQRDRIQRGGHHQLLAGREPQPGADRDFGQTVEVLFEFRCLSKLFFGKGGGPSHVHHYHAGNGALTMLGGLHAEERLQVLYRCRHNSCFIICGFYGLHVRLYGGRRRHGHWRTFEGYEKKPVR